MENYFRTFIASLIWLSTPVEAATTRIKDVTQVRGTAAYGVSGIGLVVGLAGDGDRSQVYTRQAFSNMLQRNNIVVPPEVIQSKNVALVSVQANITSSDRVGSMVDVVVSSMGDAKSLSGGTLTRTLLFGPDQTRAYATVQGPITVGGFSAGGGGPGGASLRQNHPMVGQIVNGARVIQSVPEPEILHPTPQGGAYFELELNQPDYISASKIASAINKTFPGKATAIDQNIVKVLFPPDQNIGFVDYLASIEPLSFEPDNHAKILVNERSGTIVATEKVTIAPCAISVGGLTISVASTQGAIQPNPAAQGQTVATQATDVSVEETSTGLVALPALPTIDELAKALNNLGVTTRDMINIFQAMEKIGALNAEIIYQ
jgi:flagellar P-ring protein precursor FlgI